MIVRDKIKTRGNEPKIEVIGDMNIKGSLRKNNEVYGKNGIAPCITAFCGMGGGNCPRIEVVESGRLKSESNYQLATKVHSAEGIAPTLTTCHPGIALPKIEIVGNMNDSSRIDVYQRVYGKEGISPTITAWNGGGGNAPKIESSNLRIRYLTERECWRLMGFDDARIDRAFERERAKGQRYKMAGNSIVVPVLEAIFTGMYIDKTFTKPERKQTNLDGFDKIFIKNERKSEVIA